MLSEDKKKEITKYFLHKIKIYSINYRWIHNYFALYLTFKKTFRKLSPMSKENTKCIVRLISHTFWYDPQSQCHYATDVDKISDFILNSLTLSNSTFINMHNLNIRHYAVKHNHYLGIVWIITILLISLIIPNHAINLTGVTFGNFFMYIGHFLLIQFENLINPALIGRLLINVIGDVPVVMHYFLNNK